MNNIFKKIYDNKKELVLSLFIFSFIVRLLFVVFMGNFEEPQMYEHGLIARNMIDGNGFSMYWPYDPLSKEMQEIVKNPPRYEGAFIPPLNPYIIYFSFKLFGDNSIAYFWLMTLNCLFSSLNVIIIFLIAEYLGNRKAAIISAMISSLFLPSIYGVVTFSGSPLYQLLACCILFFIVKGFTEQKFLYFAVLGISMGLLALVRSEFLAIGILLSIIVTIIIYKKNYNRIIRNRMIVFNFVGFLIFVSIIAPWVYRNTTLFGQFTSIVSHPWHEIWRGNNINVYTNLNNKVGGVWITNERHQDLIHEIDNIPYNQNKEIAIDALLHSKVTEYWKSHPFKAMFNMAERAIFIWTFDIYHPKARSPIFFIFALTSSLLFWFGLKYLMRYEKQNKQSYFTIPFLTLIVVYWVIFSLINLEPRYQVYILSLTHIIAGYGFIEITKLVKAKLK